MATGLARLERQFGQWDGWKCLQFIHGGMDGSPHSTTFWHVELILHSYIARSRLPSSHIKLDTLTATESTLNLNDHLCCNPNESLHHLWLKIWFENREASEFHLFFRRFLLEAHKNLKETSHIALKVIVFLFHLTINSS